MPTTNLDVTVNLFEGTLAIDGASYTLEQALAQYPDDTEYLIWFAKRYF